MIPHVIDFETEAIQAYPSFPPRPVGVSILWAGTDTPQYLAWGHPSGNNSTFEQAKRELAKIWDQPLLFHNARFDLAVAEKYMDLPWGDPLTKHDTMYQLFLRNPHAPDLQLKPSAHRILGIPPDEQTALRDYLAGMGFSGKHWGAAISKAPGDIVADYAKGDVYRTYELHKKLISEVPLEAYQREQRLAPILNANERDGIRINLAKLQADLHYARIDFAKITDKICSVLGTIDLDSGGALGKALIDKGFCKEDDFLRTPTGKMSVAKASLDVALKDPVLRGLLSYRGKLKTIIGTFMESWEERAYACGDRLHPQFHQVRGAEYGTRTGRLSSSDPNFQNVPTEFDAEPPEGFPPLPIMREYVLPDSDDEWVVPSDFHGQEMRIAAHFAEGRAAEIYRDDPQADFHAVVAKIIHQDAGLELPRKYVKITGFTMLYGGGVGKLAESLGVDRATAQKIRGHYFAALPGLQELMEVCSDRGKNGLSVRTWGEREVFCEPPTTLANGRRVTFEYKMLNHLIQGSAADQTKESVITAGYKTDDYRFMITVHDENVYSVKKDRLKEGVKAIRESMENQEGWDVPWKCDVEYGPNWAKLSPYAENA